MIQELEQLAKELESPMQEPDIYEGEQEPEPLDENEIKSIINAEMQNASTGTFATKVDKDREEALSYYLGNPRGDEKEGRSQVVSTDVADVIEWQMPQLMEAITAKGAVVAFDAISEEDEEQAELETEFTHDVFMKENEGFLNLYQFVKDALMMKNGVFKIYWDDTPETVTERYTGLAQQEVDMLLSDPDVQPRKIQQELDQHKMPLFEQQRQMLQQQGQQLFVQMQQMPPEQQQMAGQQLQMIQQQLQQMQPPTITDVVVERVTSYGRVKVDCVTPEEFRVNQYHNSLDLSGARFCAHSTLKTVSDLIEEGYDPDKIKEYQNNVDDYYRREYRFAEQDETTYSQYGYSEDESQSLIEVSECYMRIDINQDDVAELMKITVIGSEDATCILDMEEIDTIPFVSSSCIIMPHKYIGLSMYDRVRMLQDQKTSLWRNILDNLYLQNNREKEVVEGQVNIDDLLVSRPGGIKRVKAPNMIREMQVQPIGQEGYQMLDYCDQVRTGRSGVSPDTQGQDLPVGMETAHGVERMQTAKEKLTGLMIRAVAETGIKPAYTMIRDLLVKHQNSVTSFKFKGQWVNVNPSQWGNRSRITAKVGTGTGDDMRKQAALQQVLMYQEKILQNPSQTLVTEEKVYNALDALSKSSGLGSVDRYFLDPNSEEGQSNAQQVQQQQAQIKQQKEQLEQAMAMAQVELGKAETMKGQAQMLSQQVKAQSEQAKVENERAKLASQRLVDEANAELDAMKLKLEDANNQIKAMESGQEMALKKEQMEINEAMELTKLELQAQRELNESYEANKA